MGFLKIGGEFPVNAANTNYDGRVATLADGRFVVIWTDDGQTGGDTSGNAVRGQIFAADGTKSGDEFLVNTTTAGNQSLSNLTGLDNGRFVVTWLDESQTGGDTSGTALRAQIFEADGTKRGSEFLLNTTTTGDQRGAATAALGNGGFVATWTDGNATDGYTTRGQIFAVDGSKIGGEFLVGTAAAQSQAQSKVATLADGRFVITWTSTSSDGSRTHGQLFASDGSKIGDEFPIGPMNGQNQNASMVTGLADGRFVVTWNSFGEFDAQLRGQVFAADGTKEGDEFVVDEGLFGVRGEVTALADGRFVVTWAVTIFRDHVGVLGQVFAADGSKSGSWFVVGAAWNDDYTDDWGLRVAAFPDGRFVATWSSSSWGDGRSGLFVRSQIFDATHYDGDGTNETVTGGNFADTLRGQGGDDVLRGGDGGDDLNGGSGADRLNGDAGNDRLDGGAWGDRMAGGTGNDVYFVDHSGDLVFEVAGQGTDTVNSTVSFNMGTQAIENLMLLGSAAIGGTGNNLANGITGNSGNNVLNGGGADDTLKGGGGNDTLDGGTGYDRLEGGAGNDRYLVANAADGIIELSGQGYDTVTSYVSFDMGGQYLENLYLAGNTAINGTGNSLTNIIAGNSGANALSGLAGNDTLNGLGGNDTLSGGTGDDVFAFSTALNSTSNRDTITDFSNATGNNDTIRLDDAVFTKLAAGVLNAANFRLGAAALDANDYIIYNQSSGVLSYDVDGSGGGAAVQFAVLSNKAALSAADFLVI